MRAPWSHGHSPTRRPPPSPFPLWAPLWSLPTSFSKAPPPPSPSFAAAAGVGASSPSAASPSLLHVAVKPVAAAAAGTATSHPLSPLRCSAASASDPLSSVAAARAYTDYYLAAFTANVCECIASAARSNKALLQQTHMLALTAGVAEISGRSRIVCERACPVAFDAPISPYANVRGLLLLLLAVLASGAETDETDDGTRGRRFS